MNRNPKVWCGHIKWFVNSDSYGAYWRFFDEHNLICVAETWTRCPICGKKRPKK